VRFFFWVLPFPLRSGGVAGGVECEALVFLWGSRCDTGNARTAADAGTWRGVRGRVNGCSLSWGGAAQPMNLHGRNSRRDRCAAPLSEWRSALRPLAAPSHSMNGLQLVLQVRGQVREALRDGVIARLVRGHWCLSAVDPWGGCVSAFPYLYAR
jgi:hypothetical protein